jgi:hypothetical protein
METSNSNSNYKTGNMQNKVDNEDFKKIITDLCKDLFTTFPELNDNLNQDIIGLLNNDEDALSRVFNYCKTVFPERFFDILYQNAEMFSLTSEMNTHFLPGIDFKYLWNSDISDKTKDILWKYLQLILFCIVNNMSDSDGFGDTAKLFEAINGDEFKKKLEETINNMKDMFNDINLNTNSQEDASGNGINLNDLPDAQQFHEHINGMMDGKLGKLAREIAEETANDLNIDPENIGDAEEYFKTLFKNPTKLMGLVKNVGDKLDHKIKSGQIKESELIEEASNIVKRMKDMPGMENIQNMLSKMGIPNMGNLNLGGRNSKVNFGELQNQLNNNLKKSKMKERLRRKMEDKSNDSNEVIITEEQREREENILKMLNSDNTESIENLIFSKGEKGEKSLKSQNPNKNKNKSKK